MSLGTRDLMQLRWPLLVLAATMSVAVACIILMRQQVAEEEASAAHLQVRQRELRSRLNQAPEEARELGERIALLQELERRQRVGPEERQAWMEQIGKIQAARRLSELQYEFSPQRPLTDALMSNASKSGRHEWMASRMHLQLPMLHEGDLFGLLDDLRASVSAHLLIRDCAIERLSPNEDAPLAPPLAATCHLDWITLQERQPE